MDDYYDLKRNIDGAWADSTNIPDARKRFNPWDIGLSNEEISIIAKSKGIIGLILDERVSSGAVMNKYISSKKSKRNNRNRSLISLKELRDD